MKPQYIATPKLLSVIEGYTIKSAYCTLKKLKKDLKKPPMYLVSLFEFSLWKETDYQLLMIDMKAGKLRRQFLYSQDIVRLEHCTERTAFARMASMRKAFSLPRNECLLLRHYAEFAGVNIEELHERQKTAMH